MSNKWIPEYAIPPGWLLQEYLEARDYSQAEFARRCGRTPKLISEIISGKAPLTPSTALQFEKVLGLDAHIWTGIETKYRLFLARESEIKIAETNVEWANRFPLSELIKGGHFSRPKSSSDRVSALLRFFRVASVDAWDALYAETRVAYRHSPSFSSNPESLFTWLRLGEIEGEQQDCAPYHQSRFKKIVQEIRDLTCDPIALALQKTQELCNEAGVAFALVKPLKKTSLSGLARWLSPQKAMIQLTARHKSDDQLWFSFFHEAAHILLHSKRHIFMDGSSENISDDQEAEANEWAAQILIPQNAWEQFVQIHPLKESAIKKFADDHGIAPGIVVGRLQHEELLHWNQMNHLRVRYKWED